MIYTVLNFLNGRNLSFLGVAGLVLALILGWFVVSRLRQYYRLRHFGGPGLAGFSRLWLVRTIWSGQAHLRFWSVTEQYGLSKR